MVQRTKKQRNGRWESGEKQSGRTKKQQSQQRCGPDTWVTTNVRDMGDSGLGSSVTDGRCRGDSGVGTSVTGGRYKGDSELGGGSTSYRHMGDEGLASETVDVRDMGDTEAARSVDALENDVSHG